MPNRRNPPMPTPTLATARRLRADPTDAESRLWYRLRAGRLCGLKFRRQHPIPPYVLDFYCAEFGLAVELDGSQHDDASDASRTASLERNGIRVLRFWDNDVLTGLDRVLEAILRSVEERRCAGPEPSPLAPLPMGEG